ncbi:MAG: spermidine synthase [Microgenomates group bacterium ADurb.Bin219]|nr:MAG: spermidine synthase [Microgenomates group bacterium ADurb.Bin219]
MKLKSFFKRLFNKDILEKFNSPFNGEILVVKELSGKTVMRVGGISQSGGLVEKIWKSVLFQVHTSKRKVQNCLILGFGAGTVAKILEEKWPGIKITGIEIDQVVIKIGKKYFGLDKIGKLKIIVGDAIQKITNCQLPVANHFFDLILIDLYRGQEFPKEAESKKFLNGLKKILSKDGLIIFNRLNFGNHKTRTAGFIQKLKKTFPKVAAKNTEFNLFISCGMSENLIDR